MEILIVLVLVLINAAFALAEIAIVSSKKARLEVLKSDGKKGAHYALLLLSDAENFLSSIQVGITLISIVSGVYGATNIAEDFIPVIAKVSFFQPYATQLAFIITVLILTYVSIVIGELVPKTIALSNPEKMAIKVARPVYLFSKLFFPFVKLLSFSTSVVNKLLGIQAVKESISEAELRQLIKNASHEGIIDKDQDQIHEKIFYFADKKAKHIMTHRTEIDWLNIDQSPDKIKMDIDTIKHSKILCCNGDIDHFTGILFIKDYYKNFSCNEEININELLIEPVIIPENVEAKKVLHKFKQNNIQICCVVNEYGSLEGIITLHDIIENILGDITDNNEQVDPDFIIREDGSYLVNGDASIEILTSIMQGYKVNYEEIEYSTLAGFIFHLIDRIPRTGEIIQYKEYRIEIIDMDGNKIDKILISKP